MLPFVLEKPPEHAASRSWRLALSPIHNPSQLLKRHCPQTSQELHPLGREGIPRFLPRTLDGGEDGAAARDRPERRRDVGPLCFGDVREDERPPAGGFSVSGRLWARAADTSSSRDHSAQRSCRATSSAVMGSRSVGKVCCPNPRTFRSMTWPATTSSIGSGSGTVSPWRIRKSKRSRMAARAASIATAVVGLTVEQPGRPGT